MHDVHLRTRHVGDIWLVPKYTGSGRQELTYADAQILGHVRRSISGAEVIEFHGPLRSSSSSPNEPGASSVSHELERGSGCAQALSAEGSESPC